jgi:hypothetical protein
MPAILECPMSLRHRIPAGAAVLLLSAPFALPLSSREPARRIVTTGTAAVRERETAQTTIVISAETLANLPGPRKIDELIATLPSNRRTSVGSLPDGWNAEQKGRQIRMFGPARDSVYGRLDLDGNYTKDYAGKQATLQSGFGGVLDEPIRVTMPLWPRVDPTPDLEGILTYPPSAAPGQPLLIGVSPSYRTGVWSVSTDIGTVPLIPIESLLDVPASNLPIALNTLRGSQALGDLLARPEPRPYITVFPDSGGYRRVTFTDRWGEKTVDAPLPIAAAPFTSQPPAVTSVARFVFGGQSVCVGGSFPDLQTPYRLVLDGTTPLDAWGASRSHAMIGIPDTIAPGPHTIGLSSSSTTVTVGILRLDASIDQNKLWRGESTTLRLGVTGTDRPVPISVLNRTPGIISIDGGARQTVTTPGGVNNAVSKGVTGTQRGDFSIDVRVNVPGCGQ